MMVLLGNQKVGRHKLDLPTDDTKEVKEWIEDLIKKENLKEKK